MEPRGCRLSIYSTEGRERLATKIFCPDAGRDFAFSVLHINFYSERDKLFIECSFTPTCLQPILCLGMELLFL